MPDGASHLPSLGALYLHMVTDGEYHLTGVSQFPKTALPFISAYDRSIREEISPPKHAHIDMVTRTDSPA